MEREIKFRTFQEGQMYFHKLANYLGSSGIINQYVGSDKAIWMQYTGLKDAKGFEVYEGDINELGHVIKWNQLHNCFGWFNSNGFISEIISNPYDDQGNINFYKVNCKIIGNIHENPELL